MGDNKKRPNVVFLIMDDQRYDTIHALGNEEIHTPNMDRLVERGAAFLNAHIPGATKSAVCMPSRAMIHSGKTLFHLEECGKNIPAEHITLGKAFQQGGYHAAGIGKWHNGIPGFAQSFDGGDSIFFGGMWDHWNVPLNDFHTDGKYEKEIYFVPNFTANSEPVKVKAEHITAGKHSTDIFTESAVRYIDEYEDDKPFLLYCAYMGPHDPRVMPEPFASMYDPDKISLPPNFREMPEVRYGWAAKGRDENVEGYPRDPARVRKHIADYYGMLSHIDAGIGQILDALERKGILENTIIVMTADHGLAVGQHGHMGKQNLYEHSIKIPLLISGPGIPAGQRIDNYVYTMDIYPTLCELCGVPIPETVETKSFAPMFTDPSYQSREELYLAFQARIRGVIRNGWKLLEYRTDHTKFTQLFHLDTDPWERYNLFEMAGTEAITEELRTRMQALAAEWEDEGILFGQQYWQQYRQYEDAALAGVAGPMGASMHVQVDSWGK